MHRMLPREAMGIVGLQNFLFHMINALSTYLCREIFHVAYRHSLETIADHTFLSLRLKTMGLVPLWSLW